MVEFLDKIQKKNLKSFSLCYSKSPVQLCHEIFISSNSRNLLQFLQCVTVHCKEKGGKPDRKPHTLSYGLRNPDRNLKSGELSRIWLSYSFWLLEQQIHCTAQLTLPFSETWPSLTGGGLIHPSFFAVSCVAKRPSTRSFGTCSVMNVLPIYIVA